MVGNTRTLPLTLSTLTISTPQISDLRTLKPSSVSTTDTILQARFQKMVFMDQEQPLLWLLPHVVDLLQTFASLVQRDASAAMQTPASSVWSLMSGVLMRAILDVSLKNLPLIRLSRLGDSESINI